MCDLGYEIWDEEGEKKRELGGRGGIWDCRFLIADFGLLILSSLFLAHLIKIQLSVDSLQRRCRMLDL